MPSSPSKSRWGTSGSVSLGLFAILVLFLFLAVWGTQARLSGAIIVPGTLEVKNERFSLQHEQGGRIMSVHVKEGESVSKDQKVAILDSTLIHSELKQIELQYANLVAQSIRLNAELQGSVTPPEISDATFEPWAKKKISELFERQRLLFQARVETYTLQSKQFAEQDLQYRHQIDGLNAQLRSLRLQHVLVSEEYDDLRNLSAKGLVQISRLREVQSGLADVEAGISQVSASISENQAQVSALWINDAEVKAERKQEAIRQLSEIEFEITSLTERRNLLRQNLKQRTLVSPAKGVVFKSDNLEVGVILAPGEDLLYVIPDDEPLIVKARVHPGEIDKIWTGQAANIKFSTLDAAITPDVLGFVTEISADTTEDPMTGSSYYLVKVQMQIPDANEIDGLQLIQGMPVDIYMKTSERSPLNYLMKPFSVYFSEALREN